MTLNTTIDKEIVYENHRRIWNYIMCSEFDSQEMIAFEELLDDITEKVNLGEEPESVYEEQKKLFQDIKDVEYDDEGR